LGNRLLRLFDVYDVLGVAGFAALEYGIAQWSVPAAWIVAGLCLLALALLPRATPKKAGS
jgi:hypothetical protein